MSNIDNKELLSFIMLTYRNFEGITYTLDSLFKQNYPRIELIFSDDGSDNYFDEIDSIKKYIDKYKTSNIERVLYSRLEENSGIVKNINNAINLSKGKYLKCLGGGDLLADEGALSRYVDSLEQSDINIVFSKMVGFTPEGKIVRHLASCEENYDLLRGMNSEQLANYLYIRNCFPAPAWCCRRKLFEDNGLFGEDTRLIEDYPYWLKLCHRGEKIGFIDDILIMYRLDGISSAGSYGVTFMKDMFVIYDKYIFPYDNRYGVFQGFYNKLKRLGLEAYMAKACWSNYSFLDKIKVYIKYGIFFFYIGIQNIKQKRKNLLEEE